MDAEIVKWAAAGTALIGFLVALRIQVIEPLIRALRDNTTATVTSAAAQTTNATATVANTAATVKVAEALPPTSPVTVNVSQPASDPPLPTPIRPLP